MDKEKSGQARVTVPPCPSSLHKDFQRMIVVSLLLPSSVKHAIPLASSLAQPHGEGNPENIVYGLPKSAHHSSA